MKLLVVQSYKLALLAAQATADYYAGKTEELETLTEKLDTKDEMYPRLASL